MPTIIKVAILNVMKDRKGMLNQGVKTFQEEIKKALVGIKAGVVFEVEIIDVLYGNYKKLERPFYYLNSEQNAIVKKLGSFDIVINTSGIMKRYKDENKRLFNIYRELKMKYTNTVLMHMECSYIKNMLQGRTHTCDENIEEFVKMMDGFIVHNLGGDYHEMIKPYLEKYPRPVYGDHLLVVQTFDKTLLDIASETIKTKDPWLTNFVGRPSGYKGILRYRQILNEGIGGYYKSVVDGIKLGVGYMRDFAEFVYGPDGKPTGEKKFHKDVDFSYYFGGAVQKQKLIGSNPETDIVVQQRKLTFLELVERPFHYRRRAQALFLVSPTIRANSGGTMEYVLTEAIMLGQIPVIWKKRAQDLKLKNGKTLWQCRTDYPGIIIFDGEEDHTIRNEENKVFKLLCDMKRVSNIFINDKTKYKELVESNWQLIQENWGSGIIGGYFARILKEMYVKHNENKENIKPYVISPEHKNELYKSTSVIMPAAGKGTRMRGSFDLPKCLLPNKEGIPIIKESVLRLNRMGVKDIFIVVLKDEKHLFEKELSDIKNVVLVETDKSEGVMQAINEVKTFIIQNKFKAQAVENFIIWLGDNVFHGNGFERSMYELENLVNEKDNVGFILTQTDYPQDLISQIFISENEFIFRDKERYLSETMRYGKSATGVFLVHRNLFLENFMNNLKANQNGGEPVIFDSWFVGENKSIVGVELDYNTKWFDVGTPERYQDMLETQSVKPKKESKEKTVYADEEKELSLFDMLVI